VAIAVLTLGIGGGLMLKGGSSPATAMSTEAKNDLERKTDLVNIDRAVIAYAGVNKNTYPTLSNMNDLQFRLAHLPALAAESISDPVGKKTTFAAAPEAGSYAYEVGPANCNNLKIKCTTYKLSAVLTNGSTAVLP
jgi:hypothetical protein